LHQTLLADYPREYKGSMVETLGHIEALRSLSRKSAPLELQGTPDKPFYVTMPELKEKMRALLLSEDEPMTFLELSEKVGISPSAFHGLIGKTNPGQRSVPLSEEVKTRLMLYMTEKDGPDKAAELGQIFDEMRHIWGWKPRKQHDLSL
jgi:hypothetical protein